MAVEESVKENPPQKIQKFALLLKFTSRDTAEVLGQLFNSCADAEKCGHAWSKHFQPNPKKPSQVEFQVQELSIEWKLSPPSR